MQPIKLVFIHYLLLLLLFYIFITVNKFSFSGNVMLSETAKGIKYITS
jgi:hypothetical protein